MKISELATKTRVPAKTIRYYETAGLLSTPLREANGYRCYSTDDIDTLIFIRRCRELNIPIDEIKQLVAVQRKPEASCDTVDNIIAEQLARVRQTQQELAQLEQALAMLATSCSHKQVQNCAILQSLKAD
ncbi:MAG: MerR family transcriptional regulator [Alteromonadaceae bacterium]|uniref:MerR family transcriptional regulator n=1 Tax=Rheinheimera TaxID=67575 RepID=UPI000C5EE94C|nr:MerR family transcriptional regulator [Rheinheimera sp.]MBJ91644.1 MerR family transcriptional regulator [Alteromonadaceae bacterium]|tara:strand:- start:332 stop:721 length:390 start_codon:yes stop_codon:yes gene_type:complete